MIKTFTLRYPEEMRNRLMAQVGRRGGTLNGLLLTILWEWLAEQEAKRHEG